LAERNRERAASRDPHQVVVSRVIDEHGGQNFLDKLHAQVCDYSAGRQPKAVIDCELLTIEQTRQAVETALCRHGADGEATSSRPFT
jgi:hypothetical protein